MLENDGGLILEELKKKYIFLWVINGSTYVFFISINLEKMYIIITEINYIKLKCPKSQSFAMHVIIQVIHTYTQHRVFNEKIKSLK